MRAHTLLFFDASAETGTKHAAPAADRRAFAGSVIVGRLHPEIYATSWFHFAYLELSMAFGDIPFGPDHAGFARAFINLRSISILDRRRAEYGGFWEPVLLAGTPENIAALEQSFSPEPKNPRRGGRSDRHHKTAD
jgi:hypothetical protein